MTGSIARSPANTRGCAVPSPGAGIVALSPVSQSGEISVSRVFDAPRELVYRAFVDPDQLCQWSGPAGFSVPCETVQGDVRAGGFQRFVLVERGAGPGARSRPFGLDDLDFPGGWAPRTTATGGLSGRVSRQARVSRS